MESLLASAAQHVALFIELAAVLVITWGALQALAGAGRIAAHRPGATRRSVWLGFAPWLLLGLEFELAADIVRTAIAPTWRDIGQLAAIAGIRTFLGYFLERDIREVRGEVSGAPGPA